MYVSRIVNLFLGALAIFAFAQFLLLILTGAKIIAPTIVFDIIFIITAFLLSLNARYRRLDLLVFLILATFFLVWLLGALNYHFPLVLIVLEAKPFIFALVIAFILLGSVNNDGVILKKITLKFFLASYCLALIPQYFLNVEIRGMRPFVFQENNFEYLLLFGVILNLTSRKELLLVYSLVLGSISALSSALFIYAMRSKKFFIFKMLFIFIAILGVAYLFISLRGMDVSRVDRYIFMVASFQHFTNSGLESFLFGNLGSLVLQTNICDQLLFYDVLDIRICTGVLTHLFFLRYLFNFGIISLILLGFLYSRIAHLSFFNFIFIMAIVINGFSVGAVSSGIIAFTAIIFLNRRRVNSGATS